MSEAIEQAKATLQKRMQAGQAKAVDPETVKSIQARQVKAGDGPQGACLYLVNVFTGEMGCIQCTAYECGELLNGEWAGGDCPS
jgi:hypothetical protein